MKTYNPKEIEEKWLKDWEAKNLFQSTTSTTKKDVINKFYALFAFAYPSGSGLHVGHVESKTALDILVRYLRMVGKDVFFPVGWDAFGLPAENYAIKTGIHPAKTTIDAIHNFESQVKRIGISYDWSSEIATFHPEYYKWTQWIFIQLFKSGLAYRDKSWVNWCPNDKTVLANEQVVNGECERCGAKVIQRELEQWKFRITDYKDELLSGLDHLDWPKATKQQQKNWIGKSNGLSIYFKLLDLDTELIIWTTAWETIFGVTFIVIAPEKFKELNLIQSIPSDRRAQVLKYLDEALHKTEEERRVGEKDKSGVDTGLKAINPVNGSKISLFIADYVLLNVGTGVVMGVPAHDKRDFQFATKFKLPVIQVIKPENEELTDQKKNDTQLLHTGDGILINSLEFNGLQASLDGKNKISAWLISKKFAEWKTTYKLRDWLISRQRYWGTPIPMLYCERCAREGKSGLNNSNTENTITEKSESQVFGWYPSPEDELPIILPEVADFKPTDDGKSPLEKAPESWKYGVCPGCGARAKREVDTMDTFVDSSWYFLRYVDARNKKIFADREKLDSWLPVDMYLIGPEHTVLHLLYSRFFTKFLRDKGYLSFDEPFIKMRHQGMILGPDGKKMSKSKGNVINPDEIIEKFGADTLRIYEMFMGPLDTDKAWDTFAVVGVYRFLSRIYSLVQKNNQHIKKGYPYDEDANSSLIKKLNQTIKKVGDDIPSYRYNTAISSMMEFINDWTSALRSEEAVFLNFESVLSFLKILSPFAPFMSEDLYKNYYTESSFGSKSIHELTWPIYREEMIINKNSEIAVQINGKLKLLITLPLAEASNKEHVISLALQDKRILKIVEHREIKRTIFIEAKLLNIVI